MRRIRYITAALCVAVLAACKPADNGAADGKTVAPAYVYAAGGKFDRSFSEALWRGAERFKQATGIAYVDFEISRETQFEQAYRHFASRGRNPIIGVGFSQTNAVQRVARDFPNTKFVLIDGNIDMPNVLSVEFKEEEGSFLVGVLAAMASKTHRIGFVGGMDIPLIRKFACGYRQGVHYADPDAKFYQNMTGATPEAWTNPARGAEIAREQFDQGVDVIYAAAGTTGMGVLQAAADRGKLAIGVDSNQNYMHPGTMLTSMVKRVDNVAFDADMAMMNGTWKPGHFVLGLKERGVDWAYDQYNRALITPEMKAKVEKARADIVAGRIKVHNYQEDGRCAY